MKAAVADKALLLLPQLLQIEAQTAANVNAIEGTATKTIDLQTMSLILLDCKGAIRELTEFDRPRTAAAEM